VPQSALTTAIIVTDTPLRIRAKSGPGHEVHMAIGIRQVSIIRIIELKWNLVYHRQDVLTFSGLAFTARAWRCLPDDSYSMETCPSLRLHKARINASMSATVL
jgi:hypothetical protein